MNQTQKTDDLDMLIELLPQSVQKALSNSSDREELIEVILDLGRLPEARYPEKVITIGEKSVSIDDLQKTINKLGKFGTDNRAGIERTLHRISAIRNRQKDIIGLTCRVGRAVFGTVEIIRDMVDSGQSLLLMGRPGVGKTTALREIARVMADDLQRRVVIIDTSNEIAGDGDIPHPAIGRARRMQVGIPEHQHQVMIEAVENHMPEVIVIDEIGTELEANAARTIAERGVQLVATAHGNSLSNLIKNPTLSDLIGGIQSVTLGDEEAKRRRSQKTVLERAAEPTFPIAVEMNSRNQWSIHSNVASTVDSLLRGQPPLSEYRSLEKNDHITNLNINGVKSTSQKAIEEILKEDQVPMFPIRNEYSEYDNCKINSSTKKKQSPNPKTLSILCCGISKQLLNEAIRRHEWPATCIDDPNKADVILTVRNELKEHQMLKKEARNLRIPIHVIKSNTLHQIERSIKRLIKKNEQESSTQTLSQEHHTAKEDALSALEECRLALEKIVLPFGRPVELLPRSKRILQMQADLAARYRLRSDVFGHGNQQRLRVYPP